MAKLQTVCPHCHAKYSVSDHQLSGKNVTCKKCSQKFVAEVKDAAAASPETQPVAPADDPLVDDPFGDFSTFTPEGPVLAKLPPKKPRKSSLRLPVVPILFGGVGLFVVVAGVFGILSLSATGVSLDLGYGQVDDETAYAAHRKVTLKQYETMVAFLEAVERINGQDDLKGFVKTVENLTRSMERLASDSQDIPGLPRYMHGRIEREVHQDVKKVEDRVMAAGQKLQQFDDFAAKSAVLKFHEALGTVSGTLGAANERSPERQIEAARRRAIADAEENEPDKLPELRYRFALEEYQRIKKVIDRLPAAEAEEIGDLFKATSYSYRMIMEYAQQIRDTPVFQGEAAASASRSYVQQVLQQHADNEAGLDAGLRDGVPRWVMLAADATFRSANAAQASWDAIQAPRPQAVDRGRISPSWLCFTPEEEAAIVKRHADYRQRTGDRSIVVMFVDRRYGPELEIWKEENFDDQCDEMETTLMTVIWRPLRSDIFLSRILFGTHLKTQEMGGVNVVVMPYDETVLSDRKKSAANERRTANDETKSASNEFPTPNDRNPGFLPFRGHRNSPLHQPPDEPRDTSKAPPDAAGKFPPSGPAYSPPPDGEPERPRQEPPPSGRGSFPAPGMRFERPPGPPPRPGGRGLAHAREAMGKRYGAENIVTLEAKSITSEQSKAIRERLRPMLMADAHTSWLDSTLSAWVIQVPYQGDIQELASKIDFAEVEEVNVDQRRIRLKSIKLP